MERMPPSPSWSCSSNGTNRLDGGLFIEEKDDLALFNDMEMKEEDNFLVEADGDDLDESFSTKLRDFSTSKPGIKISVRGESIDLLNGEGGKHDYDWLLTPPGSPVFTSLDDEKSLETFARLGRPRSQPPSSSRSSRAEKGYRNSRSSASPHRSGQSLMPQARGRPSSASGAASSSSSTPTSRARTHSPSFPRNRPSTPPLKSSSPTFQKMGLSGTSLSKTSRGNSSSPKLRAWQSSIIGLSSEAPPNLRTSMVDRPASYVRGSSPASKNGRGLSPGSRNGRGLSPTSRSDKGVSPISRSERGSSPSSRKECETPPASRNGTDSSPRYWRHSMSPTASVSASSLYSYDGDPFSSRSKGSVASSGDDDVDSLRSVSVGDSYSTTVRKLKIFPHSTTATFSKTLSRTPSPSSVSKKSSVSTVRKMDKKRPQAMFRPLLMSIPNTTLYQYRHTNTKNLSVVTSKDASFVHGDIVALCTDGSDLYKDDDHTKCGEETKVGAQEESKVIGMNEDVDLDIHNNTTRILPSNEMEGMTGEVNPCETEHLRSQNAAAILASTSAYLNIEDLDSHENETSCSICGSQFSVVVPVEESSGICQDCNKTDICIPLAIKTVPEVDVRQTNVHFQADLVVNKSSELIPEVVVPELEKLNTTSKSLISTGEIDAKQGQSCLLSSSLVRSAVEKGGHHLVDEEAIRQTVVCANHVENERLVHNMDDSSLEMDVSGDTKIPIRPNSELDQGRAFSVTDVPPDLTHSRSSTSGMKISIARSIVSTSPSVQFSPYTEKAHYQQQSSGRIPANVLIIEHERHDASSFQKFDHSYQKFIPHTNSVEWSSDAPLAGTLEHKTSEEAQVFAADRREAFSAAETLSILADATMRSCVDNYDQGSIEDPSKCSLDELDKHSVFSTSEKDDPSASMHENETETMGVKATTTDTLLLCNPIVDNLAYQAAVTVTEKKNLIPVNNYNWPTVTTSFEKTNYDHRSISNPYPNSHNAMQTVEKEGKFVSTKTATNLKSYEPMEHIAMVTNKGDNMIPQKVEAKCSCIVM